MLIEKLRTFFTFTMIIFGMYFKSVYSQNLVQNGDFESYDLL